MNDITKIAILTTVANYDLYRKTSKLFPPQIDKYIIDGTQGMYGIDSIFFMIKKLKTKKIDWLIMADEDVVFFDSKKVFEIIKHMKQNKFAVCGIRDGGVVSHRNENPWAVNTFFTILNFKEIVEIWNKKEVQKNQYILNNEFSSNFNKLPFSYNEQSLYEPYYSFFFWLKRKSKKILYLDSKMLNDNISNKVYFEGSPFLIHTWYARSYGESEKHTKRINEVLLKYVFNDIKKDNFNKKPIIFKDNFYRVKKKIKKKFENIFNKTIPCI